MGYQLTLWDLDEWTEATAAAAIAPSGARSHRAASTRRDWHHQGPTQEVNMSQFEDKLPRYVQTTLGYLDSDEGCDNLRAMLSGKHPHCGGVPWSFDRALRESVMFATKLFSVEHVEAVADEVTLAYLEGDAA